MYIATFLRLLSTQHEHMRNFADKNTLTVLLHWYKVGQKFLNVFYGSNYNNEVTKERMNKLKTKRL